VYANGTQKTVKTKCLGNARLEPVPGGVFWLTWREGTRQKYLRVNVDVNDAVAAQLRQERVLGGEDLPAIPPSSNRRTLVDAIAAFLDEKAVNSLDPRARARWNWDLEQFAKVCAKNYLDEIDRRDIFKWMAHFQDKGAAARTVYNRTSSIGTFLKKSKVNVEFTFSVQKKGGDIPNYTEREAFVIQHCGCLPAECCRIFKEIFEERHKTSTTFLSGRRGYYGASLERQSFYEIVRN